MARAIAKIQSRAVYRGANSTSSSWTHKVLNGGNRLLLCKVFARNNGTVTAPTYGGVSLTLVPGSEVSSGSGTSRRYVSWYYMPAPTVGSATFALTVASADSGNYGVIVYNCIDVDQTTPFRSQGGGNYALLDSGTSVTSTTLTPASDDDDLVLSALYSASAPAMGSGQYKEGGAGASQRAWAMSKEASSTSTSISATMSSNTVVHSAIAIIGDATTQPDPADYAGGRGKKSWCIAGNLAGEVLGAGTTLYCSLAPSVEASGTSSANRTVVRNATTLSAPAARVTANAASGSSTYTLQVNGSDTGVTITIPAGATGEFIGSGTTTVASGDGVGWKLVTGSGGAVTLTHLAIVSEASAAETITYLGAHSSSAGKLTPGETREVNVYGSRASTGGNTDIRKAMSPVFVDADWKGLSVSKVGTTTNGIVAVTSRVNGATGAQALSYASGATSTLEDTANTDTLVDGDVIGIKMVSAGASGDFEYERILGRLVNTNGEFLVGSMAAAGNGVALGAAGTQYVIIGGELGVTSTESAAQMTAPFDFAAKRLWFLTGENTSAATGDNIGKLRVNGADTALTVSFIAFGEHYVVADLENVVNVNAGDLVSISATHGTGGGSNTLRLRGAGFVGVERAAGSTPKSLTTSLGAALQAAKTAATAISAAVQSSRSVSSSLSASAQVSRTAAAQIDAAVRRSESASASLDTAVQAARLAAASVNAAVQVPGAASSSIAAAVQQALSATTTLDTAVQAAHSAGVSATVYVQAGSAVAGSISAGVQAPRNVSLSTSVAVQLARQGAADLSAAVQAARAADVSLSAQVLAGTTATASVNAAVQRLAAASVDVSAAVQRSVAASTSLSAFVSAAVAVSASVSAAVGVARAQSAALSAYVSVPSTGECPTADEIAAAVLAAMNSTPPLVNVKQMNDAPVIGDGTEGNPWRGVGVPP